MKLSDNELIAIGLQIQEARRKGGRTVFEKYGAGHFSKLGKLSAAKKAHRKLPIDTAKPLC